MTWSAEGQEGNEAGKVKWDLVEYTRGMGLDLGCGPSKPFPHFIGVDSQIDTKLFGVPMQPDVTVKTCENLAVFGSQSMDFVFSSHLLEHIEDTGKALAEWWRVLKVGGYLVLYLPHKLFYPNIGQPGSNPDHKHDFMPDDIIGHMKKLGGWDLVRNEDRNDGNEYSFFQVYRKLSGPKHRFTHAEPKPEKTVAVCRYGAFGDILQASSLFAGLKKQGYHVSLYTTPSAWEVVKHDPNIDRVCLQDNDQIPNHELGAFWGHLARTHTKFINLSETVEGTLLAIPGRIQHTWPLNVRQRYLDVNYAEFAHDMAGVPHDFSNQRFYPGEDEKSWARKERGKMGGDFVILWSLSGSSVHKTWPHIDALFARVLVRYPNARIVTVGDSMCKLLESGWENESRVVCRSGVWSIRETLAFLGQADLVVGPETGVLSAAAMLPVAKIITLSHSSVENLTKHWNNTVSLTPKTACYPCHMMHYSFEFCHRDEQTGVAQCQADISVETMWDAVQTAINMGNTKAA